MDVRSYSLFWCKCLSNINIAYHCLNKTNKNYNKHKFEPQEYRAWSLRTVFIITVSQPNVDKDIKTETLGGLEKVLIAACQPDFPTTTVWTPCWNEWFDNDLPYQVLQTFSVPLLDSLLNNLKPLFQMWASSSVSFLVLHKQSQSRCSF